MAGRGALRGVLSAWLGLIALHAISTKGGSGRVTEFFTDVNRLIERALDPAVPAIPDLRAGQTWGGGNPASPFGPDKEGHWPSYNVPVPGR